MLLHSKSSCIVKPLNYKYSLRVPSNSVVVSNQRRRSKESAHVTRLIIVHVVRRETRFHSSVMCVCVCVEQLIIANHMQVDVRRRRRTNLFTVVAFPTTPNSPTQLFCWLRVCDAIYVCQLKWLAAHNLRANTPCDKYRAPLTATTTTLIGLIALGRILVHTFDRAQQCCGAIFADINYEKNKRKYLISPYSGAIKIYDQNRSPNQFQCQHRVWRNPRQFVEPFI